MLSLQTEPHIAQSLNSAYVKLGASQAEIDVFKYHLADFFGRFNESESEEYLKNLIADLLKNTYYKGKFEINTKDRKDLVIHNGKAAKDSVGVIIETKTVKSNEKITAEDCNTKSLHELILYYFDEREAKKNIEIKYLIATTGYEWYVFDENSFDKLFYRNRDFITLYKTKNEQKKDNPFFYKEAAKLIQNMEEVLPCTFFDLRDFRNPKQDNDLLPLYKILSPAHLLKQPFANDSNSLNQEFYNELLHIMGLEEVKEGGKKIIVRQIKNRNDGSLIENAINLLTVQHKMPQISNLPEFGDTDEEQLFSVGLELVITWLNRVLFLKLLEGQLIKYHNNVEKHIPTNTPTPAFLHSNFIKDFNDLDELFFEVLALETHQRSQTVKQKYGNLPYLNSSLFEETELEKQTFHINTLKHRLGMPFYEQTVLKDIHGKTLTDKKGQENQVATSTLDYLFRFLDAYDFASEPTGEIRAESKTMINAAVLGLIFEKINGYKDGSFFTPGFITMYMCRETISRAVLQKFGKHFGEKFETIPLLRSYIASKVKWNEVYKLNAIFNTIRICDPAVGSGHFLVSALNELIAIKSELGILVDIKNKQIIQGLYINIENDDLEIEYFRQFFRYNLHNHNHQNIQETIFHEKQTLIENCLFGVDINPKSVMICRLRLWIELLKNMYYRITDTDLPSFKNLEGLEGLRQLQTLPNLDINIKVGNSLVSRFDLKNNFLSKNEASRKKQTILINKYKEAVFLYKNANDKKLKAQVTKQIKELKEEFKDLVIPNDADYKKLKEVKGKLEQVIITFDSKDKDEREYLVQQLDYYEKLVKEKQQTLYSNAFEWRFEFPEVLDENGDFMGFDVVVANPPYILVQNLNKKQVFEFYKNFYKTAVYKIDTYHLFYELGIRLQAENSFLSFITPNTYLRNKFAKELRSLLLDKNKIIEITNFHYQVFKEASVDTLIYVGSNMANTDNWIAFKNAYDRELSLHNLGKEIFEQQSFKKENLEFDFTIYNLELFNKIYNNSVKVSEIGRAYFGIQTFDRNKFVSKLKLSENYKPVIDGSNIGRYSILAPNEYVDFRKESIKSGGDEYYYLTDRIGVRQIGEYPQGSILKAKVYTLNTIYNIVINNKNFNLLFVLGILNSSITRHIWQIKYYDGKDTFPKIKKAPLESLPIPNISLTAQTPFITLVDKILLAREKDPKADTQKWEIEIDQLVYELYQLTPEEIATVEESYLKK